MICQCVTPSSNQSLEWLLPESDQWVRGESVRFLALSNNGVANILRPNETQSVEVKIRTPFNVEPIEYTLSSLGADNETVVNWDEIEAESRPNNISTEGWSAIWDNLETQTGTTWGDYVTMLGENANYLAGFGDNIYDHNRLFQFEVEQASGLNPNTILASSQDAVSPATGFSLVFNRVYNQSIGSRYNQGILGRGWQHNYDYYLENDGENILFYNNGTTIVYIPDGEGGYASASENDLSTLIQNSDNSYTLTGSNNVVYTFNSDFTWSSITDENNNTITATYNNDNLSRISHSSGQFLDFTYNNNLLTEISDDTGQVATYEYDPTGEHLITVTDFDNIVTNYTYDPINHALLTVSNEQGNEIFYSYDQQERLSQISLNDGAESVQHSYNSTGEITVTDAQNNTSTLSYNWQGRLLQTEDELGRIVTIDTDNNRSIITLPDGTRSQISYDEQGYPTIITDALGNSITTQFDAETGNLQWLQDTKGNNLHYTYDDAGNLTTITHPDSTTETFTYDNLGNLTQSSNRRGDILSYSYNPDGLLLTQQNGDGTSFEYTYDLRGNLLSLNDTQGITNFAYDNNNNLTQIDYATGYSLNFTYNGAGYRISMTGNDGYAVNYGYDDTGRLSQLTDGDDGLIVSYSYDSLGRLSREDKGNGTYTTYSYDQASQLLSIVHYQADNTVNSRYDYTYDTTGQIIAMSTLDGDWTYSYDANGQLINADFVSVNPEITDQILTYQYDAAGNRIQTVVNGLETAYVTNNLNQYTTAGTTVYNYDADGNLISKIEEEETTTYSYNDRNQLIEVIEPDGTVTEYEYDGLGNRVATIYDGVRTEYVVDPFGLGNVVAEYDINGNLIASYSHGLGLETRFDGSNAAYYDFNHLGSTVGLSDTTGNYVNSYAYSPFGQEINESESIINPFEFVGQYGVMEEANGLDFMRARYYDSELGRFTAVDPIGLNGEDANLYRYVENTPTHAIDPEGLWIGIVIRIGQIGLRALRSLGRGRNAIRQGAKNINKNKDTFAPGQRKTAEKIAREAGNGKKPIHHDPHRPGQRPHYHPADPQNPFRPDPNKGHSFYGVIPPLLPLSPLLDPPNPDPQPEDANNPPPPEPPPGNPEDDGGSDQRGSLTPEDKFGPEGYDPPNTPDGERQRYISPDQTFNYRIDFWNDPDATVPTQVAIIRDTLDPNLDWDTLNFTEIGFLRWTQEIPGGQTINTRIDMNPDENLAVDIDATFDPETGEIVWIFEAVDPITGDPNDVDPLAGFLPPFNEETEYELGWVEFTVEPKDNLTTGTLIQNQAFVQFDLVNDFNPAPKEGPWTNTIDVDAPISNVEPLPTETSTQFTVSWTGTDVGSGIGVYDIYVSEDGQNYTIWLDDTAETSATYTGEIGKTYHFFSASVDNVGNQETLPTTADTSTTVTETIDPIYNLDIDGNGVLELQDYNLINLYASELDVTEFDFLINNFSNDLIGNDATRSDANSILSYLNEASNTILNIDGNEQVQLQDYNLINLYASGLDVAEFGFLIENFPNDLIGQNSPRISAESILDYFNTIIPETV